MSGQYEQTIKSHCQVKKFSRHERGRFDLQFKIEQN